MPEDTERTELSRSSSKFYWLDKFEHHTVTELNSNTRVQIASPQLDILVETVGLDDCDHSGQRTQGTDKPVFEFLALAEEVDPAWPRTLPDRPRIVFFREDLSAASLPDGHLKISAHPDDLLVAMRGLASIFQAKQMIGIDLQDLTEAIGGKSWSDWCKQEISACIGHALCYSLDNIGLSNIAPQIKADITQQQTSGFDGSIVLNWMASEDVLDMQSHVLRRWDLLATAVSREAKRSVIHALSIVPKFRTNKIVVFTFRQPERIHPLSAVKMLQ